MNTYSKLRKNIAYGGVDVEQLQSYFESINKWDFVKKIRDAEPKYIEDWFNNDNLTEDNHLIKAIARATNQQTSALMTSAKAHIPSTVPPTPSEQLAEAKLIAKSLVNAEREHRKFADVEHAGNFYTVSEWDIMMIMSLLMASKTGSALPTDNYWRTANNTNVNLTAGDLESLDNLIKNQIQNSYVWSWTKKAQIDACTTVAELDALDLELTHL